MSALKAKTKKGRQRGRASAEEKGRGQRSRTKRWTQLESKGAGERGRTKKPNTAEERENDSVSTGRALPHTGHKRSSSKKNE